MSDSSRTVMVSLCREFHSKGWMTGTGGAISMRTDQEMLLTPSGVLKEKVGEGDMFGFTGGLVTSGPSSQALKPSSCQPNFQHIYRLRPDTRAIFHTHSPLAVVACLMCPGPVFRAKHLHMIKGMRGHGWEDTLTIPIVENRATEDGIAEQIEKAVSEYPGVDAVLIRRHGLYVWGNSWIQAKVQLEALEWIFEVAIEMKKLGLDPADSVS